MATADVFRRLAGQVLKGTISVAAGAIVGASSYYVDAAYDIAPAQDPFQTVAPGVLLGGGLGLAAEAVARARRNRRLGIENIREDKSDQDQARLARSAHDLQEFAATLDKTSRKMAASVRRIDEAYRSHQIGSAEVARRMKPIVDAYIKGAADE